MSDEMTEEDWELHLAKFFPRCPLCGSKSLEFDIVFERASDYVDCYNCHARWEVVWKGENYAIESVKLVEVRDVDKIGLKGTKYKPQFWLKMALETKEAELIAKEKEVIREKEVIIKVRCSYCGKLYNEVFDVCPHCGGKR